MSSNIHVVMQNIKEGKLRLCILFCMGQLKLQWGRLKIKLKMSSNEHV